VRNRRKYPKDWKQLSTACKERAGWCCERCGVAHGTMRTSWWTGREWPVYLQAAHVKHDPHNQSPELVAVCPACHWRYFRRPGQRAVWVMLEKLKHQQLITQAYLA